MQIAAEQVLVETLVSQLSIEAFQEAVLHRLSRRDVVPFDTPILLPGEHGIRGEFGSIVTDLYAGIAAPFGNGIQLTGYAFPRDRVVDHGCQTVPTEVIDHAQNGEAAPVGQCVRDKVKTPSLVGILRDCHRCSRAQGSFPTTTLANRQPLFLVDAVELLPVHLDALALQ